jgi:transposase
MTIAQRYVGCDISKSTLDCYDDQTRKHSRIGNDNKAIAALIASFTGKDVHVIFEATGRYGHLLMTALAAASILYTRVNPEHARAFARATGKLAKTDKIDARILAEMGRSLALKPQTPTAPEHAELALLQHRREQLVAMRAMEKCRAGVAIDPIEAASLTRHIDFINNEISMIETTIKAAINASSALTQRFKRLRTAPGVGPVVAATLLAELPELGTCSGKVIAALAGLAPINKDSGRYRGKRKIHGGRPRVRRALYMAALSAIRKPHFREFYQTVHKRSGHAKVALIAVARKLLVCINAMFKNDELFRI